jgi:hypothetical protein
MMSNTGIFNKWYSCRIGSLNIQRRQAGGSVRRSRQYEQLGFRIHNHTKRMGDFYAFEGSHSFVKWRGLLSPDQYEIVDVLTSQGVRRAMLFPKAVLRAWAERG